MSETTARATQSATCPTCGATRARQVTWCTQCYASFEQPAIARAAPGPAPEQPQADGFELSAWDLGQREAAAGDPEPTPDPAGQLRAPDCEGNTFVRKIVQLGGSAVGKLTITLGGTVVLLALFMGAGTLIGNLL